MKVDLNQLARLCHGTNSLHWKTDAAGNPLKPHTNTMTTYIASELMMARHGREYPEEMNRQLPHRSEESVRLANCLIRIFDYCGGLGIDIDAAFREKLEFNKTLTEPELISCTCSLKEPAE